VVEDDAEIGGALRRSLRLEGYDVRLAEDGVAALEESTLFEPDAVRALSSVLDTADSPAEAITRWNQRKVQR